MESLIEGGKAIFDLFAIYRAQINTIGIEEEISITDGHAEVESVTNAYTFLILMHTFLFIKYQKRHFRTKRNESSIRK